MELPRLERLNVKGKRVLLRLDLDVPLENGVVKDDTRLEVAIPTIRHLLENNVEQIIVLGHLGRPEGKVVEELKVQPVADYLKKLVLELYPSLDHAKLPLTFEENLRFNPGEEANDPGFAKMLASLGDVYINEAFAVSHREEASIIGLPKLLPHAAGFHLKKEVEVLEKILEEPGRPVVFILGGGKLDKVLYIDKLLNFADWVLVGGVLPQKVNSYCRDDGKMCVSAAHVTPDGKDITSDSAYAFTEVIKTARTIIWSGPMGDIGSGFWEGTEIVGRAVVKSKAYKVAGGGDTIRALYHLKISDKIDFISTGGGAMLEYLAYGDLPGLAALRKTV